MANILFETFKLTKPTNTLHLSKEVPSGRMSVYLMHEDREIIKPLQVRSFSGNEIFLTETINPKTVEHKYKQECLCDYPIRLGKWTREDIFIKVVYET